MIIGARVRCGPDVSKLGFEAAGFAFVGEPLQGDFAGATGWRQTTSVGRHDGRTAHHPDQGQRRRPEDDHAVLHGPRQEDPHEPVRLRQHRHRARRAGGILAVPEGFCATFPPPGGFNTVELQYVVSV